MRNKTAKHTPTAPARRKRRSAQEISERLLQAAADEFKLYGFAGATTAAIAAKADVTEAQMFRHFASKADLFREAVFTPLNRHFNEFNSRQLADAATAGSMVDKAQLYITELLEFLGAHSKLLMSLIIAQAHAVQTTQDLGAIDSLGAYFDRGAAMSGLNAHHPSGLDPKLMVRVSFAAVLGCAMFKDWIFPPGLASEEAINAAIIRFVLEGIGAGLDKEAP